MRILYSLCSAGRSNALLLILLMAGPLISAQQRSLQVIPEHSTARVFLGTSENPTSFDVGVAKVMGEMQVNADDVTASRFSLKIYSADLKDLKVYGERSVIAFQSQSVEQNKHGKLEVRGQMTVTQVFGERDVDGDYSDASPDSSRQLRTSQEVTFVFEGLDQPGPTFDLSGGGDVPVQKNRSEAGILVTASMSVNGEAFPQLLLTIQDVAWPLAVDDESCAMPSKPGEDYREVTCQEATSASIAQPNADQQAPPAGNLITIQLKLILARADDDSAGGATQKDSAR